MKMSVWDKVIAGFMLLVVGAVFGQVWSSVQLKEYKAEVSNEQRAMSNELKAAEERLKEMEDELEHQKLIKSIAMCESSGRHDGVWGDGGKSYGLFQFQYATFRELAGKMKFTNAKWKDARHQYIIASWAVRNGYGNLWSCYRKLKAES